MIRIRTMMAVVALVGISSGACEPERDEPPLSAQEQAVVQIANQYVASHYPDFDTRVNPPVLVDLGDAWRVYYKLPENVLGGTPVTIVRKSNLEIIDAFQTQ